MILLTRLEWSKCSVIILTICFWIIWNYWSSVLFGKMNWNLLGTNDRNYHDFFFFYSAGKSWLSKANPYVAPQFLTFVHPPTSLPFFGMFALFDFLFAARLWVITYLSLFLVALLALAFTIKGESRLLFGSIAVLLIFTSIPLQMMVELSQSDLLISSLAMLSLVCERLKHRSVSAVMLSIATLLQGTPILILLYFVVFRRDLQYFVRFLVSTLVIVGASLLVVPIGLYWYYFVSVVPTLSTAVAVRENQSIVGVISLAGMSKLTPFVSLAGVGSFAMFSFYVNSSRWVSTFDKRTLRSDAMFLMNVLIMLLFGPRSNVHSYVWVLLPLALFLSELLMEEVKLKYLTLVGFATFLLNSAYRLNGWYFGYSVNMTLPTIMIGNLMMTLSLILIFISVGTVFRSAEN